MGGSDGSVELVDADNTTVDLAGYGKTAKFEGAAAKAASNATSAARDENGTDTDDNSADFTIGDPTPTNSGNPEDNQGENTPGNNDNQDDDATPAPGTDTDTDGVIPIADIQGTGTASPLVNKTVTTRGVVTASYPDGGLNGYMIQTPGTGKEEKHAGDASDGIFVYSKDTASFPEIGTFVEVTGTVAEFKENTQLTNPKTTALDEEHEDVTPVAVDTLPAGAEAREAYESMLIQPGTHTVTNNFGLNRFGEIGLAPGEEAFRQPSDIYQPRRTPTRNCKNSPRSSRRSWSRLTMAAPATTPAAPQTCPCPTSRRTARRPSSRCAPPTTWSSNTRLWSTTPLTSGACSRPPR